MPRIAFSTLGCKINQFDTAAMQTSVMNSSDINIVSFDDEADIYVINTCTVTNKSDSESRRIIRGALKKNRNARIVVTGCYAQTNPREIAEIPGVSIVLGNNEKMKIGDYLNLDSYSVNNSSQFIHVSDILKTSSMHMSAIEGFEKKTRAILKIQDGCDSRCAYCIVPFARGGSRSLSRDDVIKQVRSLCRKDYKEVVLSGVHLGGYGRDLLPQISLSSLISTILSETDLERVRLSSIEPREVTDELIELMAAEDRICRHFHIPLQSGDREILNRMNRNYDAEYYESLLNKIKDMIPDAGIGCDVMVGYPGEEDRHFENTYRLIEKIPLTYLHVFAYSPREGTAAFSQKETVKGNVKAVRSGLLRGLGDEKSIQFKTTHIGRIVDVLVEDERDGESGLFTGYTGNYLRVLIQDSICHPDLISGSLTMQGNKMQRQVRDEIETDLLRENAFACINKIIKIQITGMINSSLSGKLCR